MRRRLRRVVPPGMRGRVVRDGRERRLHLRGLFPKGRWCERRRRRRRGHYRSRRRERCGAGDVDMRRRAESAVNACHDLLVSRALRHSSEPSNFTGAAARASAGQLALRNGLRLNCITKPGIQSRQDSTVSLGQNSLL